MLGLAWNLPGCQPNETPPGGALIFSLWRDSSGGRFFVRIQYIAQTMDQIRAGGGLTLSAPPASQILMIRACKSASPRLGCDWVTFDRDAHQAIDPARVDFVAE
jgi:4-phytase/acid phosphatase